MQCVQLHLAAPLQLCTYWDNAEDSSTSMLWIRLVQVFAVAAIL